MVASAGTIKSKHPPNLSNKVHINPVQWDNPLKKKNLEGFLSGAGDVTHSFLLFFKSAGSE